jgi:macrolide transport system ATP-binding/permease protein
MRPHFFDQLFRRDRLDQGMSEEIRFHIAERCAELQRSGMSPDDARRRAQIEFGGIEGVKDEIRDTRRFHLLHDFFEDIRFGLRLLRRNPAVSLLALFCLTIGIGANAAVFSWIEGILLRPYPLVAHQERMMAIIGTNHGAAGETGDSIDISWPDFQDLARNSTMFDAFIVDRIMGTSLAIGNRAQSVTGSLVSHNYFDALGVRPILGRGFEPQEDVGRNAHPVAVISYHLWQDRFHGDPAIVGKTQMFNNVPHTIVGVAPKGFYGTFTGWAMEFWVPMSMQELFTGGGYKLEDRGTGLVEGYVMLKPGVTRAQAQTELDALAARLEQQFPSTDRGHGVKLYPLWATPFNNAGTLLPTLTMAVVVVLFVLLIVCANVSNLLLTRGLSRQHEMTVRIAIGARRSRLLRQLLTEGFVLAAISTVAGLLLARWCRDLMAAMLPARGGVRMNLPGEIDWRVMALSTSLCLITALLFGLVPAIRASRVNLASSLKAETAGVVGGHRRGIVRAALVLLQVALSFVLLVGAGLLLKSLREMQNADPGFSQDRVLVGGINFVPAGYDVQRTHALQDQIVDRLKGMPGVESAAFARGIPFTYTSAANVPVYVDGMKASPDEWPIAGFNEVGPDYLATVGIPVVFGREFTRADDENAPPVAVINQAMADQFWPGRNPVGLRLQMKGTWMQIVGVARNVKNRNMTENPVPFFYVPLRQSKVGGSALQVRTSLAPQAFAQTVVREIQALDANLALGEVITMREEVERTMAPQRIALVMISCFAVLALLLAAIGLYGVMSYVVSQSTRELGLRMALGAGPRELLRLVLSYGLTLTAVGLAVGLAVAFGTSRLLGYLLYHVSPRDPLPFTVAFVAMLIAGLGACLVPALRAIRIDPLRALRS